MGHPARLRVAWASIATAGLEAMTVVFGDTLSSASTMSLLRIAPATGKSFATCLGPPSVLATVSSSTEVQSPA
eukprot:8010387-Pyramimonas_sp.AAC.2